MILCISLALLKVPQSRGIFLWWLLRYSRRSWPSFNINFYWTYYTSQKLASIPMPCVIFPAMQESFAPMIKLLLLLFPPSFQVALLFYSRQLFRMSAAVAITSTKDIKLFNILSSIALSIRSHRCRFRRVWISLVFHLSEPIFGNWWSGCVALHPSTPHNHWLTFQQINSASDPQLKT